ncbi:hypothetical protein [Bacterioplanoides sp.]|uniref:hypothetical protein n=1 Tax=Bacterioplanoides sp. TaxID=2066072 RepID=UPI003B5A5508
MTTFSTRISPLIYSCACSLTCFLSLILISISSYAEPSKEAIDGVYQLGAPERGQQKLMIQYGELNGRKVLAAAACQGCPPAVYTYQEEPSKTLKTDIFMVMGLYLIRYDNDSFVVVQPDKELGRAVWTQIGHANIYSKNPETARNTTREQITQFSLALSDKIMNQEVGELSHSAGTYHLAAPMTHLGRPQRTYEITFNSEGKKSIDIKPCDKCGIDRYEFLPNESSIIGVDVYRHATSYYLFDIKDGVLIYTFANAAGLGRDDWSKHSKFNLYSNNQAYVRQLLASQEKQQNIDNAMAGYFKAIKDEFIRQAEEEQKAATEQRDLPAEGYADRSQKQQALKAAKQWANNWGWKETLKDAYFTSNDWSTLRHPLTGIVTGKSIRGIVTMTHPDGRCRFQYTSFRQDHDGQKFYNLHMTGVGPIYDIRCDKL